MGQSGVRSGLLQGWRVWDSVFFLDIAARGYVYEQYYAFFPLLPWLLSLAPSSSRVPLALVINTVASVVGTVLLFRLGEHLTGSRRLAATACIFFILNPAASFHAAPYTEATFAAATITAMYWLYCRGRLLPAAVAVAVSCGLRSNGVVNAGYLGHFCLSGAVAAWPSRKALAARLALQGLLTAAVAVSPLILFQAAAYLTFCRRGSDRSSEPLGGAADAHSSAAQDDYSWPRAWCSSRLPYVYGFVQAQYWNVGFLRYYTLQQLPNFLLAAPVLLLSLAGLAEYCRANVRRVLTLGLAPLTAPPPRQTAKARNAASTQGAVATGGVQEQRPGRAPQERHSLGAGRQGDLRSRPARSRQGLEAEGGDADGQYAATDTGSSPAWSGEPATGAMPCSFIAAPTAGASATGGSGSEDGYLRPELAVFMYPWAFSLVVALTAMHVQVSTRFLTSACPPLYWFMAHVWLRSTRVGDGGGGGTADTGGSVGGAGGATQLHEHGQGVGKEMGGSARQGLHRSGRGLGRAEMGRGEVPEGCGARGWRWPPWCSVALWLWCFVYIALGCVLFINFMPWT